MLLAFSAISWTFGPSKGTAQRVVFTPIPTYHPPQPPGKTRPPGCYTEFRLDLPPFTMAEGFEGGIPVYRIVYPRGHPTCKKMGGDPHLETFDGVLYDLQAAGEFVGVESVDGDLEIQYRLEPIGESDRVSVLTAVAAKAGGRRVGLYAGAESPLRIDGDPVPLEDGHAIVLAEDTAIAREGDRYVLAWPDHTSLVLRVRNRSVDASLTLSRARKGEVRGLFGDGNGDPGNDFEARDGREFTSPPSWKRVHGAFGDSWRVPPEESLFDYEAGESTGTFTKPGFPSEASDLDSIPDDDRERALEVCQNAGVREPFALRACVIDVAVTGNEGWAEVALAFQSSLAEDPGLLAHFPLDGDAREVAGPLLDGEIHGPRPTEDRFGNPGGALQFDGEDDYVKVPLDINPSRFPELTIVAWARADSIGGTRQLVSHDDGGFDRSLGIDSRGGVDEGWSAFAGTGGVVGGRPVEPGEWTFLAAVYEGLIKRVRLHVDDEVYEKAGRTQSGERHLRIGSNPGFGEFFAGAIDDVRIYSRALSRTEVARLASDSTDGHGQPSE